MYQSTLNNFKERTLQIGTLWLQWTNKLFAFDCVGSTDTILQIYIDNNRK